jgi:DNA-binding MarR family transcriptional regulator
MKPTSRLSREVIEDVRDNCLCFASQRAARELARRFDRLFADVGLTNGQFSMMVAMSGVGQPKLGRLAAFLAMDHATLTAALKKLERRGLVEMRPDEDDRRVRRVALTDAGHALVAKAVPLWRKEHAKLEADMAYGAPGRIRRGLTQLARAAVTVPDPA